MLNQTELKTLNKGETVNHFLLVRKIETRLTKNTKEYLYLELSDASAIISANVWDNVDSVSSKIKAGSVVNIKGIIDDYQGTPQIKVNSILLARADDGISAADFLPKSKRNFDEMKNQFEERINTISNKYLNELLKSIFNEERFKKFSYAPAGKSWHHSYIHGLLEHTLEIIRICDLMCEIHPELNRDLLISGAMLHDFGKTEELSFESGFDYTTKGRLLGHIVISAMLIDKAADQIKNFPSDLKNCLIHLVLSHQGKLEFATPVVPKTLEAIALYQADELSAKVNAYKNALSEIKTTTGWTKYLSLISTELYNHGISSSNDESLNKTLFD